VIDILRSLGITLGVSAAAALFLSEFNVSFIKTFIFVTIIQFIAWHAFTYYNRIKVITKNKEIEREIAEEISKQTATLPCAYCNELNVISVRLDEDNEFDCLSCNRSSAVYIDIETVAKTEPMQPPPGLV
jgi:Ca2+/Na+ antiporter